MDAQDGNANTRRLWEWLDATMTTTIGNPGTTFPESAGWGRHTADLTSFLGQEIELKFHLDSDNTIQLGGLAIDDVAVMARQSYPLYLPVVSK